MADLQHPARFQGFEGAGSQLHNLPHPGLVHCADVFQPHLGDLLEGMALGRGAVDVLAVIIFQGLALFGLGRLGDGEGHVRLEGQQAAVQVGEGDDLLRREETPVLLVEAVFLEPAHVVFTAAGGLIEGPQAEGGPLFGLQNRKIKLHSGIPFLSNKLCAHPRQGCGEVYTSYYTLP